MTGKIKVLLPLLLIVLLAANAHDTLEAVYRPCIDFSGVTALAEEEIARLIK